MTAVGDATFFYTGTEDPESDVVAELAKNQIWQSLPAVAGGPVPRLPAGHLDLRRPPLRRAGRSTPTSTS